MKNSLTLHDAFETLFWNEESAFETSELTEKVIEFADLYTTPSERDDFIDLFYQIAKDYQERAFELGYRTAMNLFFIGIVPRDYEHN